MNRPAIKTALLWGVAATLLLPVVLAVVLGLGGLLAAVGDAAGAKACSRMALVAGAAWLVAIVATTATTALALLDQAPPPRRLKQRRRRRRERLRRPPRGLGEEPGERRN